MIPARQTPPAAIGLPVERVRDYQTGIITTCADGQEAPTGLPKSNVLFYDLAEGCSCIVRPSGTEPKIKLYVMARGADAEEADTRLNAIKDAGMKLVK